MLRVVAQALTACNGELTAAIEWIYNDAAQPPPPPPVSPHQPPACCVAHLVSDRICHRHQQAARRTPLLCHQCQQHTKWTPCMNRYLTVPQGGQLTETGTQANSCYTRCDASAVTNSIAPYLHMFNPSLFNIRTH